MNTIERNGPLRAATIESQPRLLVNVNHKKALHPRAIRPQDF